MSLFTNPPSMLTKATLICAAFGLTPALAAEGGAAGHQAASTESGAASDIDLPDTFGALDRNGDGVLSREEGAQIETERWERMDNNGDGKVDRSEFDAVELEKALTK